MSPPRSTSSPSSSRTNFEILSPLFMQGLIWQSSDERQTSTLRFSGGPQKDSGPERRMTPVELSVLLAAIAALIFFSALFSGLETALFSLRPHQLRRLEQNHPILKNFVRLFRDNPRRVLNGLLLGDGLVKVPLVVLCLILLWRGPFAGSLPQWLTAIVISA